MNQEEKLDLIISQLGAIATQQERTKALVIELVELCQHIVSMQSVIESPVLSQKALSLAERLSEESRMRQEVGDPELSHSLREFSKALLRSSSKQAIAVNGQLSSITQQVISLQQSSAYLEPQTVESQAELPAIDMLKFCPPVPLPRPKSPILTPPEMLVCEWFYRWREPATGEPNIRTRQGLLWYVYGIKEGRASSTYCPLLGESMGQRVRRIIESFS